MSKMSIKSKEYSNKNNRRREIYIYIYREKFLTFDMRLGELFGKSEQLKCFLIWFNFFTFV